VNNNISSRGTIIPVAIAALLLPFGWFYYFLDIGSLLDTTSDLLDNHLDAKTDDSGRAEKDGLGLAMGKDGEDGEDGISIGGDGFSAAIANGGNGGNGGNALAFNGNANARGGDANGGDGGTSIGIPTQ
jgi:hypothetical protein